MQPRQIVMYLCRELTDSSFISIGKILGKKDHSTVMHGVEKIKKEMEENEEMESKIAVIKKKLMPS